MTIHNMGIDQISAISLSGLLNSNQLTVAFVKACVVEIVIGGSPVHFL